MPTLTIDVQPCPTTPLNLQFGIAYAPRVDTPPWIAYVATEIIPGVCQVCGYDAHGRGAVLFDGELFPAFRRFAQLLRMDV